MSQERVFLNYLMILEVRIPQRLVPDKIRFVTTQECENLKSKELKNEDRNGDCSKQHCMTNYLQKIKNFQRLKGTSGSD